MKRSLSDSQEGGSKKLRRSDSCLPELYGFSDEQTLQLNTLKIQNVEIFCKRMQQMNEIDRIKGQLQTHQDRVRKYQQRLGLIEEMLHNFACFVDLPSSLVVPPTGFLHQMNELATKISSGRDSMKKQFQKFALDLEQQILLFISSYEKERAQWESIRSTLCGAGSPELAQESQRLSQDLDRLISGQYERMVQTLSYEEKINTLLESQADVRPLRAQIHELKTLLEQEHRQHEQLTKSSQECNETPVAEPSNPVLEAPIDVSIKFECSQIEANIQTWLTILKNRQQIVEEMKAEKEALEKDFSELAERHEPSQGPSPDLIKTSAAYRFLERQNTCAEPEALSWKKETETLSHIIQDLHRAKTTDAEQQVRLEEVRTKNYEEKLECLDVKTKNLMKENAQLAQKLQQKTDEHPSLATMRALVVKMTSTEEQIRKQKTDTANTRVELVQLRQVLSDLESQPGHSHLVDESNAMTTQIKRIQETINRKDKEIEEVTKQFNASQAQERDVAKLTELYKTKHNPEKIALLETVAEERALTFEYNELLKKIEGLKDTPLPVALQPTQEQFTDNASLLREIEELERREPLLQQQIKEKQTENQHAEVEIEAIENEFLSIQSENSNQTKRLVEAEETNLRLIGDRVKHNQINTLTQRKGEILTEKASKMDQKVAAMEEVVKRGTKKIGALDEHISKCTAELQNYRNAMDVQGTVTRDLTIFIDSLKLKLEENAKEMEKQRGHAGESISALEEEKAAGLRLSEDLELLRKQLDHWIANGEGEEAGEVEQQLNFYKKMINCSHCNEKPKDCLITRCFHVFCRDCLMGEKKCPKCGITYTERDLQNIYI